MRAKSIAALTAATVVAVGAALTASMAANAAAPFTDTVSVSNHQDSGNNGNWALDTFQRTTTITSTGDGTYKAVLTDVGTFTGIAGNTAPDSNTTLPAGVTGTLNGTYSFTVDSATGPTKPADDGPYDDATANTAPSTESWVARYFPADATVTGNGDWSWTYDNACQSWTDAASGTHQGDISMVCDSAHAFTVSYVCRIPDSSQNVWLVTNNTDKPQKFHAAIEYGSTVVWFGWDDRAALAPGTTNGLVSPHAGTLHVRLAATDHGDDATVHSDGHYCS